MTDGAATSCKWTEGLTKKGDYYEGVVVDAERYLQLHAALSPHMGPVPPGKQICHLELLPQKLLLTEKRYA